VRDTYGDKVSEASPQDFAVGDAVVVSNATSYRQQRDIDTDVAAIHGPKFAPCVNQLMKNQAAQSQPAGAPIVASFKITAGSGGGPANHCRRHRLYQEQCERPAGGLPPRLRPQTCLG
jgi:hypothetical protein